MPVNSRAKGANFEREIANLLIDDLNLKTKYWKNEWTPYYNNIETDCILIHIIPDSLELVSLSNNITGNPKTWKPKTITF